MVAGQVIQQLNLANLTYVPAADANGAVTFTITASDGSLSSSSATVTLNIAAVNDAPVLANGSTLNYTERARLLRSIRLSPYLMSITRPYQPRLFRLPLFCFWPRCVELHNVPATMGNITVVTMLLPV